MMNSGVMNSVALTAVSDFLARILPYYSLYANSVRLFDRSSHFHVDGKRSRNSNRFRLPEKISFIYLD